MKGAGLRVRGRLCATPARLSRLSRRSPQEDDAERSAALRREGLLVVQVSSSALGAGRAGTRRGFPQHLGLCVKVCGTTLVPKRKCHLCPALSQLLPASLLCAGPSGLLILPKGGRAAQQGRGPGSGLFLQPVGGQRDLHPSG